AGERLPHRDREGRRAHVEVGRTGERLHALPALRRGLRGDRQVGEGVRGAGSAAERHDLVPQQPAVRLCAIRRQHRLVRGHDERDDRVHAGGVGFERLRRRGGGGRGGGGGGGGRGGAGGEE